MTIASILNEKGGDIITASLPITLEQVCKVLREHRIGAVVLKGEDGQIAGIVSERDIVRRIAADGAGVLQSDASSCMTSKIVTCTPADTIQTAMERMTSGRFRHMPIMEGGKLVGMISIGDLVKRRIADAEREAEEIKSYLYTT